MSTFPKNQKHSYEAIERGLFSIEWGAFNFLPGNKLRGLRDLMQKIFFRFFQMYLFAFFVEQKWHSTRLAPPFQVHIEISSI